jgi:hypothetical protein
MSLGLALPAFSAGAATPAASTTAQQANPFFAESPLPLHFPQFDKIKDSDFAPAFDAGMAQQLKEVEAIANNKRRRPSTTPSSRWKRAVTSSTARPPCSSAWSAPIPTTPARSCRPTTRRSSPRTAMRSR